MPPGEDLDLTNSQLQREIQDTEARLRDLKRRLQLEQTRSSGATLQDAASKEDFRSHVSEAPQLSRADDDNASHGTPCQSGLATDTPAKRPLSSSEYRRYSRQLIMPEIGLQGQLRLKKSKVLVVGVGGLGCPAAAYLAGAGVGTIGLVDGDTVEVSNLHRQIAHSTDRIACHKTTSAIEYLRGLNPDIDLVPHTAHLTPQNTLEIFGQYDVVLDCTDHPTSRYLISDACVILGLPSISASALRTEGQLMVLNRKDQTSATSGPCYRCIFPKPPPPESIVSCGDGGILGPVVGVMGVLQALETIKVICDKPSPPGPTLLLFSAYSSPPFRTVRLRPKRSDCAACSSTGSITAESLNSGSLDYVAFCGISEPAMILQSHERVSASSFHQEHTRRPRVLIDIRDQTQYELCSVPGSVNVPWHELPRRIKNPDQELAGWLASPDVVLICQRGNDSQLAVRLIKDSGASAGSVKDIKGGFRSWRTEVDPTWPDI